MQIYDTLREWSTQTTHGVFILTSCVAQLTAVIGYCSWQGLNQALQEGSGFSLSVLASLWIGAGIWAPCALWLAARAATYSFASTMASMTKEPASSGEAEPTAEQPKAAQPPGVLRKAWDAYKVYVLFVAVPVAPALIVFAIWKCTSMLINSSNTVSGALGALWLAAGAALLVVASAAIGGMMLGFFASIPAMIAKSWKQKRQ